MENEIKYLNVRTKTTDPKLAFRIPKKLKDSLDIAAKRTGRTINAEVILRLTKSLESDEFIPEVPKRGYK